MIIVSGCPRSGTSLTMDIMRSAVGEENIMGAKQPNGLAQHPKESDVQFSIRSHLQAKAHKKREDKGKDMNPNGFWECKFSVGGIKPSPITFRSELEDILENKKSTVCKVVSQGLLSSDSRFIDKIIYLHRHPRTVAKSQEKLTRGKEIRIGQEDHNIIDAPIHSPKMYIEVTLAACRWFLENPEIPVLFIAYENMLKSPSDEIEKIEAFVGYGNFEESKKIVDPKLNRSVRKEIEHNLWEDAEFIYDNFLKGDYQMILDEFSENRGRQINRERDAWVCPRIGMKVNCFACQRCISTPDIVKNHKIRAAHLGLDYLEEPCLFECGMNIDTPTEDIKTIEESIDNHSWIEG